MGINLNGTSRVGQLAKRARTIGEELNQSEAAYKAMTEAKYQKGMSLEKGDPVFKENLDFMTKQRRDASAATGIRGKLLARERDNAYFRQRNKEIQEKFDARDTRAWAEEMEKKFGKK